MQSAVVRVMARAFSRPLRRCLRVSAAQSHSRSRLIEALQIALPATKSEVAEDHLCLRQPPAGQPIWRTFRNLDIVTKQGDVTALPTAEWWAEFRQQLAKSSFRPDHSNWVGIAQTVSRLLRLSANRHSISKNWYPLPSQWYPLLVDLANHASHEDQLTKSAEIRALFQLLAAQRIQFNGELHRAASELLEFECYSGCNDNLVETVVNALTLGLPLSESAWKRAAALSEEGWCGRKHDARLLDLAAGYWALRLPGAPSPTTLHRLILERIFKRGTALTCRWQKLHKLLGEEFMPQHVLRQLEAGVSVVKDTTYEPIEDDPEIGRQLMRQHGAVKIEKDAVLPNAASRIVHYLLTKPDGSQTALCKMSNAHYRLIPEDVRGRYTVAVCSYAFIISTSGYEFCLLN